MEEYITIRKKTFAGFVAAVVIAIAALAIWHYGPLPQGSKPEAEVEIRSYNILKANGKDIIFFGNIGKDSVFTNASLTDKELLYGSTVSLSDKELRSVINRNKDTLKHIINNREASLSEMDYYLRVHGVQDEGYDMVAAHATETEKEIARLRKLLDALETVSTRPKPEIKRVAFYKHRDSLPLTDIFIESNGGIWKNGKWLKTRRNGRGIATDRNGKTICGIWNSDTLTAGTRTDSSGTYSGGFDRKLNASGHGRFTGRDGAFYEGHWKDDERDGFGFDVSHNKLRAGEWHAGIYKGERLNYTSERIYGIDISRYQHGKGRKYYPIHWEKMRITNLGTISQKRISGIVDYPVSFVYIKSTEGTTIRNKYYNADYIQARRHGIRCGAYHFFSTKTSAAAQAQYFIKHSRFKSGDLPPALDVEPTDRQIARAGGPKELFDRIRTWMNIVRRHTGVRPVLYVSQRFVNKYLNMAPDIKKDYNIWIARYGEYKPDIKLAYWQLCPDGRVSGIHGEVDINVFNGYHDQFDHFLKTELIK